jgi:hypothetical protein
MFKLALITAIAAALIAPAASQAAAVTPAEHEKISTATRLAVEHWGGQPSCGAPTISIVNNLFRDGQKRRGFAPFDGCSIELDYAALNFAVVCPLIVHEYGHRLGLVHVADPSNIMNESAARGAPECDRELARRKADLSGAYWHTRKDRGRAKTLRRVGHARHGRARASTLRRAASVYRGAMRWQAAVTRSDARL